MAEFKLDMSKLPNQRGLKAKISPPPPWNPGYANFPRARSPAQERLGTDTEHSTRISPTTSTSANSSAIASTTAAQALAQSTTDAWEVANTQTLVQRPRLQQWASHEPLLSPTSEASLFHRRRAETNARRYPQELRLPEHIAMQRLNNTAQTQHFTGKVIPLDAASFESKDTALTELNSIQPDNGYPFPSLRDVTTALESVQPKLFGMRTRFKPLWLIALGGGGNILYGMGTVILERGVWNHGASKLPTLGPGGPPPDDGPPEGTNPSQVIATVTATLSAAFGQVTALSNATAGPASSAPSKGVAQAGNPDYNHIWGGRTGGLAVGGTLTLIGVSVAATAATLLWRDNVHFARRRDKQASILWPNTYFAFHLFGIGLLVSHRFLIEMTKDTDRPDWVWVSTLPGVIGSSIFSVTQAQSASGSEMYNGKMPLWRRHALASFARSGVATYCLFAAMAATPGFNPYTRELTRLVAMTSFTLACFLQLTTARQVAARRSALNYRVEKESKLPALRWALWLAGRCLVGFGPNLFERGFYTLQLFNKADNPLAPGGINKHTFNEAGRGIATDMSAGSAMTTAGVMLDLLATGMMRHDAISLGEAQWWANTLLAGATVGTGCMVTYRGIIEYAKDKVSRDTLWLSTFPGVAGTALLFWTIPILFSFAELRHGDIPINQRDRLTRVLRCIAGMGFPLWSAMSAITGFNPFIREAVFIGASLSFQLANALPTTTTRRGQPQFQFPRTPGAPPTPGVQTPGV